MNKNVSGNLRHARIQSACAIAGLLLIVGTASEIRSAAINVVSMVPGIFDRKTVSKKPTGANTLVKVTNEISISLDLVSKAEFYGYVDSAGLYLEPREKYDLNLPMKNITWKQAKDFCIWSSEYSRLPYRHEWVEAVDDSLITPPTDWHEWLSEADAFATLI